MGRLEQRLTHLERKQRPAGEGVCNGCGKQHAPDLATAVRLAYWGQDFCGCCPTCEPITRLIRAAGNEAE